MSADRPHSPPDVMRGGVASQATAHPPVPPSPVRSSGRGRGVWRGLVHGAVLVAAVLTPAPVVRAQDAAETLRRGQFLRSEIVRTESEQSYTCTLAPTSGSYPVLLFRRQERVRQHEVRIYEAVVEERVTDADTGRDGVTYRVLPGREIRGETTVRESTRDLGALAEAVFEVNGQAVRTDSSGLYVDRAQRLLVPFDDLSVNALDVAVRNPDLGAVSCRITRYLTLRWQDKRPEERMRLVQSDVLMALGADFEPVTGAGRDGLRIKATVPATVAAGEDCVVRVEAVNEGKRPVACLVGRLVGRHPWFSGTNFYLGNIPPGGRREFERAHRVPEDAIPGPAYALVAFWDVLGPIQKAAQPLRCKVVAPSQATPGDGTPAPAAP